MFDAIVLGAGPAGLLALNILTNRGFNCLCIGKSLYGLLKPLYVNGDMVNPIPVVVYKKKGQPNTIPVKTDGVPELKIQRIGKSCLEIDSLEYGNNTCMDNMIKLGAGITPITLAIKQFGEIIKTCECGQLLLKISKNYTREGRVSSKKKILGYINGVSPIYNSLNNISKDNIIEAQIDDIVIYKKYIKVFTKYGAFMAKKLISTLPIEHLLSKINYSHNLNFYGASSVFGVFEIGEKSMSNYLFYNLEWGSDIFRMFMPGNGIAVVQYKNGHNFSSIKDLTLLSEFVNKVCHSTCIDVKFVCDYSLKMSYPLGSSSENEKNKILNELQKKGIISIGRYGNWTYTDLQDQDWEMLNELHNA